MQDQNGQDQIGQDRIAQDQIGHDASPGDLRTRLRAFGKCVCDGARLMVGQGDHAAYVAHLRTTHPDVTPMNERAFFRHRENARFGAGNTGGFRCC